VAEVIAALAGEGPKDLRALVMELGAEMLVTAAVTADLAEARGRVGAALDSGRAMEKFASVIEAQGGEVRVLDNPSLLPAASERAYCRAERSGTVTRIDTAAIGRIVNDLGGGRRTMEDSIDPAVGVVMRATLGDPVGQGTPLVEVHASSEQAAQMAVTALAAAILVADEPANALPLVSHRVTAAGVTELG